MMVLSATQRDSGARFDIIDSTFASDNTSEESSDEDSEDFEAEEDAVEDEDEETGEENDTVLHTEDRSAQVAIEGNFE